MKNELEANPISVISPKDIAVNQETNKLYVSCVGPGRLCVIDGANNNKTILYNKGYDHLGMHIATNPNTNTIYTTNEDSDSVSVLNGKTGKADFSIPVGNKPSVIAVNAETNTIYVANSGSDSISVIDGEKDFESDADEFVAAGIESQLEPRNIAVNPRTGSVYVTNSGSNTASVVDGETDKVQTDVTVGDEPVGVAVNPRTGSVYVTNSGSNTSSVINGKTNEVYKNITVGTEPSGIAVNPETNTVYVANSGSNIYGQIDQRNGVSVIDGETNEVYKNITVGTEPRGIAVNPVTNTIYVANFGSDFISVIDGETNVAFKNITVGEGAFGIATNPESNTIYVAKPSANQVLLLDGKQNKLVVPAIFSVYPSNLGRVKCNDNDILTNQYLRLPFASKCIALGNEGYQFNSWMEKIGRNSSRTINASTMTLDSFQVISGALGRNTTDEASVITVADSGAFEATFKKITPPIPPEYILPLYGIIASTIIGWSIPSIIGWGRSKVQIRRLNSFHKKLSDNNLSDDELNNIWTCISDAYASGNINNEQYTNLKNEISIRYEETLKDRIDSLNNLSLENLSMEYEIHEEKIRERIDDAYVKGKLTQSHYDFLYQHISKVHNDMSEKKNDK